MPDLKRHRRLSAPTGVLVAAACAGVFWFGFFLSGFEVSAALGDEPVRVKVRSSAQVTGEDIRLKDIAEIVAAADLKEKIGAIYVESSPRPGKEKKISGPRVMAMMKLAKALSADAELSVPDSIQIVRVAQSVPEDALRKLFDRFVTDSLSGSDSKVGEIKVRGSNVFPTGKLGVSFKNRGKQELMGNVNLQVQVDVDGKDCGRLILSGWVDRFKPVVCAARPVANRSVLTASDLILKTVNVSTMSDGLVTSMADAVGKSVRMTLQPGVCLRSGMLTAPPLVQKGARVKILAGSGGLKVATTGIAKSSGRMGDQIRVENTVSNKVVIGRVTGESTVEVLF